MRFRDPANRNTVTISYWDPLNVCFSLACCRLPFVEICLSKAQPSGSLCDAVKCKCLCSLLEACWLSEVLRVYSTTGSRKLKGNAKNETFVTVSRCFLFFWGGASPARPANLSSGCCHFACDVWIPASCKQGSARHHDVPEQHRNEYWTTKSNTRHKVSDQDRNVTLGFISAYLHVCSQIVHLCSENWCKT